MEERIQEILSAAVAAEKWYEVVEETRAEAQRRAKIVVEYARAVRARDEWQRLCARAERRTAILEAVKSLPGWLGGEPTQAAARANESAAWEAARKAEAALTPPEREDEVARAMFAIEPAPALAGVAFAAAVNSAVCGRVCDARADVITAAVLSLNWGALYEVAWQATADWAKPTPPTCRPRLLWSLVSSLADLTGIWSAGVTRRHAMTGPHWTQAAEAAGLADLA